MPSLAPLLLLLALVQACSNSSGPPTPAAGSGDAAFRQLAAEILEYTYKQDPSTATRLGIHKYDDLIADRSAAAIKADTEAIKSFQNASSMTLTLKHFRSKLSSTSNRPSTHSTACCCATRSSAPGRRIRTSTAAVSPTTPS